MRGTRQRERGKWEVTPNCFMYALPVIIRHCRIAVRHKNTNSPSMVCVVLFLIENLMPISLNQESTFLGQQLLWSAKPLHTAGEHTNKHKQTNSVPLPSPFLSSLLPWLALRAREEERACELVWCWALAGPLTMTIWITEALASASSRTDTSTHRICSSRATHLKDYYNQSLFMYNKTHHKDEAKQGE